MTLYCNTKTGILKSINGAVLLYSPHALAMCLAKFSIGCSSCLIDISLDIDILLHTSDVNIPINKNYLKNERYFNYSQPCFCCEPNFKYLRDKKELPMDISLLTLIFRYTVI